tara:strand:- start:4 stop:264 length:261 start_codon:yes stop_codon:yes gene_type:complete
LAAISPVEQEMSKIVFVPLTDEMVFEHPEMIAGPITTYKAVSLRKDNRPLNTVKSLGASGAYLKGDMVSGFDVVYAVDKPIKRPQE